MHHWKRRGCRPEEDEESEIVKEEDDMVAKVFDARLVRKERGKNISFLCALIPCRNRLINSLSLDDCGSQQCEKGVSAK